MSGTEPRLFEIRSMASYDPESYRRRSRLKMWLGLAAIAATALFLVVASRLADGYSLSLVYGEDSPADSQGAGQPLGRPGELGETSDQYKFLMTQRKSSAPVTWDPCRVIHYVIRTEGGPANGLELIETAIADTSAATGLAFQYDGSTSEAPADRRQNYQPERYGDQWAPVLFAWSNPEEAPDLAGNVAGYTTQRPTPADNRLFFVSGSVVLDADQLAAAGGSVPADRVLPTLRHELGHLVGLDHINDPGQLMHPSGNGRIGTFNDGDLTGLNKLGQGPCSDEL